MAIIYYIIAQNGGRVVFSMGAFAYYKITRARKVGGLQIIIVT